MEKKLLEGRRKRSFGSEEKREKWLREIRRARRVYFFQKWADQRKKRKILFAEIALWIYNDMKYIIVWNINAILQIRAFGAMIRRAHGLSYLQQWYRMAYMVFVIRTFPENFRLDQLFLKGRWDRVKEFTFGRHIKVHNQLLGYPHHDELKILAHKLKFFEFCSSKHLQTPEILAVFEEGKISLPSSGTFKLPAGDLFVKELASGMGRGAKRFIYKNGCYHDLEAKIYSEQEVLDFLINYSKNKNSILVQNALKNHDSWKKFSNGSLSTCRIVTGISPFNECEIIPFFATLKIPVGKSDADNYSKGSIAASVDIQTGRLTAAVTSKPRFGEFIFDVNPDSGHPIKGEIVPFWNELIEFIKKVHLNFKTISVGWDVSLTEDGFAVIEGNVEWGSDVIEGPSGILIADTNYPEWFYGWAERMTGKEIIPYSLIW